MSETKEIDDDTFDYEGSGGARQCISGFGRHTAERIYEDMQNVKHFSNTELDEAKEHIRWSIGELVRWCRHFNGKLKRLEQKSLDANELVKRARELADHRLESTHSAARASHLLKMADALDIALTALSKAKAAFDPEDETPMTFDQVNALEWIDCAISQAVKK